MIELTCINLVESLAFVAEKFFKNLPQVPHLPRSKLSEKWLSFEICGSLVNLNLPRICRTCRICPRRDRLRVRWMPDQKPSWYLPVSDSGRVCYQSTNPCANVTVHPCSCQGG